MKFSQIRLEAFFALAILTMINQFSLLGQSGTSSALAGSIQDQSGALIAGAQVEARELNTSALRSVKSNAAGRVLF
jgi:hypothetical protein